MCHQYITATFPRTSEVDIRLIGWLNLVRCWFNYVGFRLTFFLF